MRKNILTTLILLVFSSLCKGQNSEQIEFLDVYFSQSEKFLYAEGLAKFEIESIRKYTARDTLFSSNYKFNSVNDLLILSERERSEINYQLNNLSNNDWYRILSLKNAQGISQDSIQTIFNSGPAKGWAYFHKKYGSRFYRFSKPILFRSDTLCLFYSSYQCSPLCGEGILMIFRKEQGNWNKWLTLYNWVS